MATQTAICADCGRPATRFSTNHDNSAITYYCIAHRIPDGLSPLAAERYKAAQAKLEAEGREDAARLEALHEAQMRRAGLSIRAIAEEIDCSPPTVRSDLRALGYPKQKREKRGIDAMTTIRFKTKRLSAGAYKLFEFTGGSAASAKPRALVFKAWQRRLYGEGGYYTWEAMVFGMDEADVIAHNEGFGRKRDAVAWAKRWAKDPALMLADYNAFWERLHAAPHNATLPIPSAYRAKGVKSTLADTDRANALDESAAQRKRVAELHAANLTRHEIAASLGISVRAVKKDLAALGLGLGLGQGAGAREAA